MRLFVDLDFLQIKKIRDRDIEAAAFVVHKSVCKFYDGDLRVIVSVGGYKTEMPKDADKPPIMIKTGVHLHWNVFVDAERAFNIRETILVDLENMFGKRVHPNNDWRDVVDSTVYGGKGPNAGRLRMMYSHKTDTCPKCKNSTKNRKECDKCYGSGRMDTGRPYFPMFVLGPDGSRDLVQEEAYRCNIKQVILDTNIRTTYDTLPKTPKFSMPEGAPIYIESTKKTGGHKRTDLGFSHPSDPKLNLSTKVRLNNAGAEWDTIQKLLHLQDKYKEVILTEVTSNEKRNQYVVHVNGPNCRYCANIQREHNSNRIYFVVSADGIVQRCHDNSDVASDEMKFGLCSKYSLMMGPIPSHMVPLLFPKSAASKLDDGGTIDGDDEQDHVQRPDKKSRRLLEIGDMISMSLYKTRWSTTLQTTSGEHMVAQSHVARQSTKASLAFGDPKYSSDIHAIDPCALGSRHRKALKELGFDNEPEQNLVKADIRVQSLNKLSKRLFLHLSNAVEMAAYLDPLIAMSALEQGFDGLVSLKLSKASSAPKFDYLLS